jgi:hypothetical protein
MSYGALLQPFLNGVNNGKEARGSTISIFFIRKTGESSLLLSEVSE